PVESIAAGAAAGGPPGTEDAPDGRDGPEAGGAAGNPRDGGAGQVPVTGVTVSGGEATVQAPFVRALFAALADDPRTAGLTRFVDSNGDCDPQVWEMLAPVTDGVMLDLKALDEDRHIVLTGESNARSLASIRTVAALGLLHEVRLLLVPGLNDDDDTLRRTAAWLHGAAPGVRVVINAFRHEGTRACARDLVEPRPADLTRYREVLTGAGLTDLTVPSP
ncbi:MAG: radical SAM protein, partial [Kineosporiaceae bacterium]